MIINARIGTRVPKNNVLGLIVLLTSSALSLRALIDAGVKVSFEYFDVKISMRIIVGIYTART